MIKTSLMASLAMGLMAQAGLVNLVNEEKVKAIADIAMGPPLGGYPHGPLANGPQRKCKRNKTHR